METVEKTEITKEHISIIRQRYSCNGMTDNEIIEAMLHYESFHSSGSITVLAHLCFPTFDSHLAYIKNINQK